MSRGAGRVEQAILAAFAVVGMSYTVEDLFNHAYPDASQLERKHRVAIKRAASNACFKTGWTTWRRDNRGGGYIYYDPCDVISYASARLKGSDYRYQSQDKWIRRFNSTTDEEIISQLEVGGKNYDLVVEGGTWWKHTRMAQAKRDGDDATYSQLKAENDAALAAWAAAFKARI